MLSIVPSRQMPLYEQAGVSLKASFVGMEGHTAVRAPQSKSRPVASSKKETAPATEDWESEFIMIEMCYIWACRGDTISEAGYSIRHRPLVNRQRIQVHSSVYIRGARISIGPQHSKRFFP